MDGALRALAKGRRPSNTSTFFLRLAMLMAAEIPAGPAPITTASYPENPAPLPDVISSSLSDRGAYTLPPPQCKQSRRRSWTALLHPLVQVRSPLIFTGRGGDLRSGLPATAPLAGCESQTSGSCEDCQDRQYVGQSIETTCPGCGKDLLTVLPNHIVHYLIFVLAGCREAAELHLHALSGLTLMD